MSLLHMLICNPDVWRPTRTREEMKYGLELPCKVFETQGCSEASKHWLRGPDTSIALLQLKKTGDNLYKTALLSHLSSGNSLPSSWSASQDTLLLGICGAHPIMAWSDAPAHGQWPHCFSLLMKKYTLGAWNFTLDFSLDHPPGHRGPTDAVTQILSITMGCCVAACGLLMAVLCQRHGFWFSVNKRQCK